jgi:hypothetical protein
MKNKIKCKMTVIILFAFLLMLIPSTLAFAAGKPSLSEKSITILVGGTWDLNINNSAKGAVCNWSSGNAKIASVDKNGLVKGIKKGSVNIYCKVKSAGKTYSLTAVATVLEPAKAITLQKKVEHMTVGETIDFNYSLTPSSSNDRVIWVSSNEAIAKPNESGTFTVKEVGEFEITATTLSGAKDSVTIEVDDENTTLITSKDLDKNNKLSLVNQSFYNVYISNSVGNAAIYIDRCNISGNLILESDSDYNIKVFSSIIPNIEIVTPGYVTKAAKEAKRPTLFIGDGCMIKNVSLKASANLDTVTYSSIYNLTIAPETDGENDMLVNGYRGPILVDYDAYASTRVEFKDCKIKTTDINHANGDYFILTSNNIIPSTIETINIKSDVLACLDIETDLVNIDAALKEANLFIAAPINKMVNNGASVSFLVAEDAYLFKIENKISNNNTYGNFTFLNSDSGNSAFALRVGEKQIVGIRLKDFKKIFEKWIDTSIPLIVQEENVTIECIGENLYQFSFNDAKVTFGIDFEKNAVVVYGGEGIIVSDVCIAKD